MKNKKHKILSFLGMSAIILISSIIRAIAVYSFIIPNKFAPGGITGIATIVEILTNGKINSGYILFVLNIPLLALSARFLNWRFTLKTLVSIFLVSIILIFLEQIEKNFNINITYSPQTEKILPALAAGVLGGMGLAMMLKIGGSSGGTDIAAALIQRKYRATSVSKFIFVFDASIVLASAFLFKSLDPIMLSMVEMFVGSRISEAILQGFKTAIKYEIITDEPEKLAEIIMTKLDRGVTSINARGMHTNKERKLLICLVRKRQVAAMEKLLKEYAPNSFTYISHASEVIGEGFPSS